MKKSYFLLLILFISIPSIGQTTVFINEIHYDNTTTDVNEGIEIAGPAGTDLSTYTITPYDGTAGTPYSVTALSGTIPDDGNSGYGAVFFPISGLQNDSPDGVALDNGGTLIQFLSYEGSFIGASGVAMNITSTDIGVSETDSTPVNESLQLSGTGSTYEDFTWSAPATHSRGGINISQVFSSGNPTINTNITAISGLSYFENNGPSNEDSFIASGSNLFTDIQILAPTNFEISLDSGTGFANSVLLEAPGGTAPATTIYVRMKAGLTTNSYSGDVELITPGAADKTVTLNGVVEPQITLAGNINSLEYNEGSGPSSSDFFSVSGMFLSNDIIVTAPANFEISLSETSGYMSSITLTEFEGTVGNNMMYVRLTAGLPEGSYSGDITASSSPVTDQTLSIGGVVNNTLANNAFESSDFVIYPNPTSVGYANIRANSGDQLNVQVFNVLGKRVLNQALSNEQLDVSSLKTGVYIIRISQDNNTTTKKLIIK